MLSSSRRITLTFGAATHVGSVRHLNEDSFCARPDLGLWLVADGMGGAASGEVASALAVAEIEAGIARGQDLVPAIQGAHEAIVAAPAKGRGTPGMGTTVVALRVQQDSYEVAWVGDSRAYLFRADALTQLTRDHSLVQERVDRGEITRDEARSHPQRNIITQVLGSSGVAPPEPDRVGGRVRPGDLFLLCSDGLNGEIDDDLMNRMLSRGPDPRQSAQKLVDAALAAGGNDNITAVVVAAA